MFVQNTGSRPGKDVVQLYLELPYREGGIEKPAVKLAAFAKTSELDSGEGELLKLSVRVSDFASYDVYDTNNNGFMGYEIEGGIGDYVLSLRTNAHEIAEVGGLYGATFDYRVPDEGYRLENDPVTGNKVENRFTNYTNPSRAHPPSRRKNALSDLSKAYSVDGSDTPYAFEYMTRADFEGPSRLSGPIPRRWTPNSTKRRTSSTPPRSWRATSCPSTARTRRLSAARLYLRGHGRCGQPRPRRGGEQDVRPRPV